MSMPSKQNNSKTTPTDFSPNDFTSNLNFNNDPQAEKLWQEECMKRFDPNQNENI